MSDAPSSTDDRIQARAYALWEQDGRPEGRSEHHWHQARSEIEREDVEAGQVADEKPVAGAKKKKASKSAAAYPGMMGDGTEEQNLGQEGDPSARITEAEVKEAFKTPEARP